MPRSAVRHRWLLLAQVAWCLGVGALLSRARFAGLVGPDRSHDVCTYVSAAAAWKQGLDPYDGAVLDGVLGCTLGGPFLYPPAILPVLGLLPTDPATAYAAVLWLKMGLLAALLAVWFRMFSDRPFFGWLLPLLVPAFGMPLVQDLATGNANLLEVTLLTGSLWAWSRGRAGAYAGLLVGAAAWKLQPAVFFALGLADRGTRRASVVGLVGLVAWFGLNAAASPGYARVLGGVGRAEQDLGASNPSLLAISTALGLGWPGWAMVALVGVGLLGARWRAGGDRVGWVLVAVFAYAALAPRMKDYHYLLLLGPAAALLAGIRPIPWVGLALAGALAVVDAPYAPWASAVLLGLLGARALDSADAPPASGRPMVG